MPAQVGERRRFGDQVAEWDGQGWKPVEEQPSAMEQMGEGLLEAATFNPLLGPTAGLIQGLRGKESVPEYALKRGLTGAMVAGGGFANPIVRAAGSPAGIGVATGAEELYRTGSPTHALGAGAIAAGAAELGVQKLPKSVTARLAHTLARAAKEEAKDIAQAAGGVRIAPSASSASTAALETTGAASATPANVVLRPQFGAPAAVEAAEAAAPAAAQLPAGMTKYQAAKALQSERGISLGEAQKLVAEGTVPKGVAAAESAAPKAARITDQAANNARMAEQHAFWKLSPKEQADLINRRQAEVGGSAAQAADALAAETGLGRSRLTTMIKLIRGEK